MSAPPRPARGVRALDLTSLADGPSAGTVLAEAGADVIRVEPPGGDPARATLDWAVVAGRSRSLTLELSDPRGAAILLRLAEDADLVIERFPPGTMEQWGLAPDLLHDANPALVLVHGHGPPATLLAQALAAAGIALEPEEGVPTRPGPAVGRHTEELFAELGLTRGELEDLRADGVV